jgi:hypothetical protein
MPKPIPLLELTDLHLMVLFRAAAQDSARMKGRAMAHLFNCQHKNQITGIITQLHAAGYLDTSAYDRTKTPCYTWIQITDEGNKLVRALVQSARLFEPPITSQSPTP